MKVQLRAGQEIEVVSPDELRGILGEKFPARRGPQLHRPLKALALDASGGGTVELYVVKAGMQFTLHWLTIDAETFTPAAPFTNASGYAEILQAGQMRDFVNFSSSAGGLPAAWSNSIGIRYHEGEAIEVAFTGGPTSKTVVCRAEGVLEPLTIG